MPKALVEMASEIITSQVRHVQMTPEDISDTVKKIYEVLASLQNQETRMENYESDGGIRLHPHDSIQRNRVICLECHKEFKLLSNRHLILHGLTSRDYKLKYGLPLRQALSARSLTLTRRKIAKEKGLGAKLVAYRKKQK